FVVALATLLGNVWAISVQGQAVADFSARHGDVMAWVDNHFKKGKIPPFSFIYGGKHSSDFIQKWKFSMERKTQEQAGVVAVTYHWSDSQTKLHVVCELKAYPD